jgi:hypothetical protein
MIIVDEINLEAINIWEKTFSETDDVYMPQVYGEIHKHSLLFIGLNPSFSSNGFRSIFKETKFSTLNPIDFFHWSNKENYSIEVAKEIERLARDKYPYYRKFKELSLDTTMAWEYIDLFFHRETNQNQFKQKIYSGNRLNDFGERQIELSNLLLNEIAPEIIVVANAFASQLFVKTFGAKFDDRLGYHLTKLKNNKIIPTFLASMFTGQRAMDVYSYQRLCWQVKTAAYRLK